jgi:cytochrome c553
MSGSELNPEPKHKTDRNKEVSTIFKIRKISLVSISVSVIILIALSILVGFTSRNLEKEASEGGTAETVNYDVEEIMSYYINARQIDTTLLYSHYTQKTSPDKEVTCLSCHEIDTLRELFLLADSKANSEQDKITAKNSIETCLVCHGTYAEVAELTKDTKLAAFFNANFHDPSFMKDGPNDPIPCTSSHIVHGKTSITSNFCHACHITINPS